MKMVYAQQVSILCLLFFLLACSSAENLQGSKKKAMSPVEVHQRVVNLIERR